jgi:hypothetical protein
MTHKSRGSVTARQRTKRELIRLLTSIENIHRLVTIRNAAPNMAAVRAIRLLEGMGAKGAKTDGAASATPGISIVITGGPDRCANK